MKKFNKYSMIKANKIINNLILLSLILYFDYINCQEIFQIENCAFPHYFQLNNGKNLLCCKTGIYVYDSNFKNIIHNHLFDVEIKSIDEAKFIVIDQFSREEGGNVIVLCKDKFYYLNSEGDYFFDYNITLTNNNGLYYTLVPYKENNKFNFIVGIFDNQNQVNILYYNINIESRKIDLIKEIKPIIKNSKNWNPTYFYGIECKILRSNTYENILTCILSDTSQQELIAISFDINNNFTKINELYEIYQKNINSKYFKIAVSQNKTIALICYRSMINENGNCNYFDSNSFSFTNSIKYITSCGDYPFDTTVKYIEKTQEYIFGCVSGNKIGIMKFDKNLNIIKNQNLEDFTISECNNIYFHNIIYISQYKNYIFLYDDDCNTIGSKLFSLPEILNPNSIYTDLLTISSFSTIITTLKNPFFSSQTTILSNLVDKKQSTILSIIPSTSFKNSISSFISYPSSILTSFISSNIKSTLIGKSISTSFLNKIPSTLLLTSFSSYLSTSTPTILSTFLSDFSTSLFNNNTTFSKTVSSIIKPISISTSILTSVNFLSSISSSKSPYSSIISSITKTDENKDIRLCEIDYFYKNILTNKCKKLCSYDEYIKEICYINNLTENNIMDITQDIRNLILTLQINENTNLIIKGSNVFYQIISSKTMNQNINKDISMIDFEKCENKLKYKYGVDYILILKIDIHLSNSNNIVLKYEAYDPHTLKILGLQICENVKIDFSSLYNSFTWYFNSLYCKIY